MSKPQRCSHPPRSSHSSLRALSSRAPQRHGRDTFASKQFFPGNFKVAEHLKTNKLCKLFQLVWRCDATPCYSTCIVTKPFFPVQSGRVCFAAFLQVENAPRFLVYQPQFLDRDASPHSVHWKHVKLGTGQAMAKSKGCAVLNTLAMNSPWNVLQHLVVAAMPTFSSHPAYVPVYCAHLVIFREKWNSIGLIDSYRFFFEILIVSYRFL